MYTVFNSTQEDVKCTVSKNGRFVAMVNRNSTINVWDAKERSAMELAGHKSVVYDCEFLNFHDLAITASADKTLRLWNISDKNCLAEYKGHDGFVTKVDIDENDNYFVTSSMDRSAMFWCTNRTNPLRIFTRHKDNVLTAKFAKNSNYVGTGSSDNFVRIFDIRDGKQSKAINTKEGPISSLEFSPDNTDLAFSARNNIFVWDLRADKLKFKFEDDFGNISDLAFSERCDNAKNCLLASGTIEDYVCLWDVSNGSGGLINSFKTKRTPIDQIKFSDKNLLLATGRFL